MVEAAARDDRTRTAVERPVRRRRPRARTCSGRRRPGEAGSITSPASRCSSPKPGSSAGFDARLGSSVPSGSGLSSSASLEIASVAGACGSSMRSSSTTWRWRGRRSARKSNSSARPVGIMDQMACSIADERSALFLDTRDLHYERVPLPDAVALVVIHSGLSHRNVGGGYAERRQQCDRGRRDAGRRHACASCPTDEYGRGRTPAGSTVPPRASRRSPKTPASSTPWRCSARGDLAAAGRLFVAVARVAAETITTVSIPEVDQLVDMAGRGRGATAPA